MSTIAVIERNKLHHPPTYVWRIGHAGNRDALFQARETNLFFEDDSTFVRAKQQHLVWSSRVNTPFLSTFSDKNCAVKWGRKMLENGNVSMYRIKTTGLTVFHMGGDEYLILQRIPKNNITHSEQILEFHKQDFWAGRDRPLRGMVRNDTTGLYYDPDDDDGRQEDEDWLEYVEYMMDH